jgi:hypothetical protein
MDGDKFFLVGKLFNGLSDHTDVRSAAEDEIEIMSAAIRLNCGGLGIRPAIGSIYLIHNTGAGHVFAPGSNLTIATSLEIRVFDRHDQRPTTMQRCVEVSRGNQSLHMAMILWADSNRTWPRLYRNLEEVESVFDGRKIHDMGLVTKAQRDRFTQSANCHEVAGPDSRHGPKGWSPPKNPMRIQEAEKFISGILGQALSLYGDA